MVIVQNLSDAPPPPQPLPPQSGSPGLHARIALPAMMKDSNVAVGESKTSFSLPIHKKKKWRSISQSHIVQVFSYVKRLQFCVETVYPLEKTTEWMKRTTRYEYGLGINIHWLNIGARITRQITRAWVQLCFHFQWGRTVLWLHLAWILSWLNFDVGW